MLAATYGTVSDIEILWTVVGATGVLFSAFNLRDAWIDRKAVIAAGVRNGRRLIASFSVRSEAARLAIQSIFVTVGILAVFTPEPPNGSLHGIQLATSIVARFGLVLSEILVLFKSIDAYIVRHLLQGD